MPTLPTPSPTPPGPAALSLQAAACVTGISKRTLWRRLGNGQLPRGPDDAHGRATVWATALHNALQAPLQTADWPQVLAADAGDASAQMALALAYLTQSQWVSAHYWLEQAARQHHADAMHWLATLAFEGRLGPANPTAGLLWLAKAAQAGHAIAQAQMAGLRPT